MRLLRLTFIAPAAARVSGGSHHFIGDGVHQIAHALGNGLGLLVQRGANVGVPQVAALRRNLATALLDTQRFKVG